MRTHRECKKDEDYLGNTSNVDECKKEFSFIKSFRVGNVAYDIDGKKITNRDDCKPLFINKNDMQKYDDFQMAKLRRIREGR